MRKNYSQDEIEKILKQEMELPVEVQDKMQQAFRKIREQNKEDQHTGTEERAEQMEKIMTIEEHRNADQRKNGKRNRGQRRWKKSVVAAAAAIAVLAGTGTVGAASYFYWNPAVKEELKITEEKKQKLEEEGVVVKQQAQATDAGVTISLNQCLTTKGFMYAYFKIEAPKEMKLNGQTLFEEMTILVDGVDICGKEYQCGYSGGLEKVEEGEESNIVYWKWNIDTTDLLDGKELTAHFKNLCENWDAAGEENKELVKGEWNLTWKVDDPDAGACTYQMNEPLTGTGFTVTGMEITPFSLEVQFDMEDEKQAEALYDHEESEAVNGEETEEGAEQYWKIAPCAYIMKDGSKVEVAGEEIYSSKEGSYQNGMLAQETEEAVIVEEIRSVVFENLVTGETYEVILPEQD